MKAYENISVVTKGGRPERRFTMMDGMIVVASLAIAFGMVRPFLGDRGIDGSPGWLIGLAFLLAGLITMTPTTLFFQLRQPRLRLHQLARQPGFAATMAASATLALAVLALVIIAIIRWIKSGMVTKSGRPALTPDATWWLGVLGHFDRIAGLAVIAAWLMLAVSGRRRPARHWLDYLGRSIGTLWVILFILESFFRLSRMTD